MKVLSREGYELNVEDAVWVLSRDVTIHLEWVRESLDGDLRDGFLRVACWYASKFAPGTVMTALGGFRKLITFLTRRADRVLCVGPIDLINYRNSLSERERCRLPAFVTLLRHWVRIQAPGIDRDVLKTICAWKDKSSPKGVAVRTRCSKKGPLSQLEYEGLTDRLVQAFSDRSVSLGSYVLADFLVSTGRRPCQLGDIKLADIKRPDGGVEEECGLVVLVPRRKQACTWRSEFKPAYLTHERAAPMLELVEYITRCMRRFWPALSNEDIEQAPLFPAWRTVRRARGLPLTEVRQRLRSEAFHIRTATITARLERTVARLEVPSERTRKSLHVFPLRLRRTVATRAAREGLGTIVIAELLDHTDDQNVRVYTENVPEHLAVIDAAVAAQLAPIVQAFSGMLVDKEAEALRGNDIASRIRCDSGSNMGTCGSFGFCGANAPLACYTCKAFQPWLDAPHREVLDRLVQERGRIRTITMDDSIAAINDRTIIAVSQVIGLCERRKAELRGHD